jgi:MerR family transcriptional regulator/heat shock protein HspR
MEELNEDTPLFVISVAAAMSNMHPQTLRQYDRLGLVQPSRTSGQSRRYTLRNIAQLRNIALLSAEGVSLEGIRRILELDNENVELRQRVRELEAALANELMNRPGARVFAAGDKGTVSVARGKRPDRATSLVLYRAQRRLPN